MSIAEKLTEVRNSLNECGVPEFTYSLSLRDQAQASFRVDLVSLGLDPADRATLEAALGGLLIGMKLLIQQNMPLPLISQYVGVCECLAPMLDAEAFDFSELPDMDFLSQIAWPTPPETPEPETVEVLCSMCGLNHATLDFENGMAVCTSCAKGIVTGGMQAIRLAGLSSQRPQVGGPNFNRGPDPVADVGPDKRLWDRTIADLLGRGKHRRKRG